MDLETLEKKKKACIVLGVLQFIFELKELDAASFHTRIHEWTQYDHNDLAWSEAFIFHEKGKSRVAFVSVCRKIAAMAFAPGGIKIFGCQFSAKRHEWCAWHLWQWQYLQALKVIEADYHAATIADIAEEHEERNKKTSKKKNKKGA